MKDLQREISKLPSKIFSISRISFSFLDDLFLLAEEPPSLELVVPIAKKLSGASEEQSGVQNLAILAFWYLLIGVVIRRRFVYFLFASGFRPFYVSGLTTFLFFILS